MRSKDGTTQKKESAIVAAIVKSGRQQGWWIMKIHGGPHQLSGVPDLLCLKDGRAMFLEVKRPGEVPTAIQRHRMNEIETKAGAPCHVVRSREEADEFFRQ